MGYWAVVHRRALRETLEMARLDNPLRALLTLSLIVGPAALAWFFSGDAQVWVRALATAGALLLASLVVYGVKLSAIPPVLASEAQAREDALNATLATYDPEWWDAPISEGVGYLEFGEWGRGEDAKRLPDDRIAAHIHAITARAFRSKLTIWAKSLALLHHDKVPPAVWGEQTIGRLAADGRDEGSQTTRAPTFQDRRHDLKINRAEFEREWPRRT